MEHISGAYYRALSLRRLLRVAFTTATVQLLFGVAATNLLRTSSQLCVIIESCRLSAIAEMQCPIKARRA